MELCVHQLTLVDADGSLARLAALGKQLLEASAAERCIVTHDVALTAQLAVTLRAHEVLHVPTATFCLCTFVAEYNLKHDRRNHSRVVLKCVTERCIANCQEMSENKIRYDRIRGAIE